MKKLTLLTLLTLLVCMKGFSQTPFFEKVDFIGAMGADDWTKSWSNFRPDTINYPAPNTEITSDITTDTKWTADKVYHLTTFVYVKNGATLTIEPGTIIRCTRKGVTNAGALIITRGSKIMAVGTPEKPIVFTSDKGISNDSSGRHKGDWGGVMIFGKAKENVGKSPNGYKETNFEVFNANNLDIWYGGNNDADNSGIMKYVRIEFAGWYQVVNNEINGLTFGAVGSGTTIDYVQCSYTDDDSFEWFGGTVNAKHLIAFAGVDDDFDTDAGYRGMIQFAVGIRDPRLWDKSTTGGSRGFESDNNTFNAPNPSDPAPSPQPVTAPIFSNVTLVGPIAPGKTRSTLKAGHHFQDGMRIRTNSSLSVFNSLEMGYPSGFTLINRDSTQSPSVYSKALADSITVNNVSFANNGAPITKLLSPGIPLNIEYPVGAGMGKFDTKAWIMQASFKNDTSHTNSADFMLVNPMFDTTMAMAPNVMPKAGSPVLAGAMFTHPKLATNLVTATNDATETNLAIIATPNPFSETTTISYTLQNASDVNVAVYDLKGNLVAQLAEGTMSAGQKSVNFDATALPKSVYMVKAVTGQTVKTLKLVVK